MSKTLIDVDDEALVAVQRELGTETKKDTVNAALHFVLSSKARVGKLLEADLLELGVGSDIADPEIMAGSRR
jgi:Arc/MetJ family transcription regulator